ncbi:rhodanese-like domain-containing protein, partial [Desulfurivibrio dismutans]|uniref:rhodanese-like domain-containing protein n=1 Tax=Desulfurivibrio dismutans TaxID=1398908 RepID=UPI0023DA0072
DFPVLTTVKLKEMLDEGKGGFFLIDTRTIPEFEEAHIKGAINIPEKSFKANAEKILSDKDALLIMYCSGVKCGKSRRTAKVATQMGYSNIMIYDDGFPVWEEKGYDFVPGPSYEAKIATSMISPGELKKMIDSGAQNLLIIDARDESEYKDGHIPTAINIPASTIASKQDILPKDKTLVIYCNAGSRSYMAYRRLMRMEYKNLRQTLFADWQAVGLPVAK